MKFVAALLASAALASSLPAVAAPPQQADTVDPSLPTQLPRTAIPHHYAITVTPHAERLTFDGDVAIDLEVIKPTRRAGPQRRRPQARLGDASSRKGRRRASGDRSASIPRRETATLPSRARSRPAPIASRSAIRAKSTPRPTACSRSITRTRRARSARDLHAVRAGRRAALLPGLGRARLQGDLRPHRPGSGRARWR